MKEKTVGLTGLLSVVILILSLLVFGVLNNQFSFLNDFISMLGAKGQPNSVLFNFFGFVIVGFLLFLFGWGYGQLQNDRLLAILLSIFGLGFAVTAIPIDFDQETSPVSKAHIVSICIGLAFWFFGLSRMGSNPNLPQKIRKRANLTAGVLATAMIGFTLGFWSMPITHRLIFGIVFGWTGWTSIELVLNKNKSSHAQAKIQGGNASLK
ncbi:DUF998 domain-containing protein [Algoriphagus sediminis]|uniref:DUF998 domain-containing protein n=1 Tax=Algoriphagus sediminis TaxID=3057113 RepID=A0ABT7YA02_9BACT|nr:DUF998 domain-containing protein [Algoriphagus sediminis]MDN3203341.1 DUF998 domain-containing protein [Algoriphagus sediminis]